MAISSIISTRTLCHLSAMEWIAANATKPAICSMSLGGPFSQVENDIVKKLTDLGIVVSVSAGNSGRHACEQSPASAPEVS